MTNEEKFNELVQNFFEALRQKTLLIIIDTASKNEKAVFSLVSYKNGEYINYAPMLRELGFKQYRQERSLFITYCAGRFSLFILDNIESELRGKGVEIPNDFYSNIQYQNCI